MSLLIVLSLPLLSCGADDGDGQAVLDGLPRTISQTIVQGDTTLYTRTFTGTNPGSGDVDYSVSVVIADGYVDGAPWLSVSPASGTISAGGGSQDFTATFDVATPNLGPGTYTASIIITGSSGGAPAVGSPARIAASVTVTAGAVGAITFDQDAIAVDVTVPAAWRAGGTSGGNAPLERQHHTAIWTGSEMIVWGGERYDAVDGYVTLKSGGRYAPLTDTWELFQPGPRSAVAARREHTAVWTGTRMILWGGRNALDPPLDTGEIYDPETNTWEIISAAGTPPTPRFDHIAVWTGTEMIVWGGSSGTGYWDTGARFDPTANTWTPMNTTNAPQGRAGASAVWTGDRLVVWGGVGSSGASSVYLDTGGIYDPSDGVGGSWSPMSTNNAPPGRVYHSAVWTGREMLVWGGTDFTDEFDSGGIFDVDRNRWSNWSDPLAPVGRRMHTAVWTGGEMIVFGGYPVTMAENETGARWSPASGWEVLPFADQPERRYFHTAVWTGTQMIVWGGAKNTGQELSTGGIFE